MIDIGKNLKEHREEAKLTQSELAKRTGISQQNISRWENNTHTPNVVDCIKLAGYYQISIDYLVGYENEDGTKNLLQISRSFNNNSININNSFNHINN